MEAIEFLDTWIKVEDGSLITDLYTKPTDKHLYVNSKSSHPTNVKKAIPYGLGLRIRRICSKEEDYQCRRGKLKGRLRKRGYSGRFLEAQLKRVDGLDRGKLLEKANRKKMDRVSIVLTYMKQLPNVHSIVRQHMDTLYSSKRMREVFKDVPIVAYRRDRNLGDLLVHGKTNKALNAHNTSDKDSTRCKKPCVVCNMFERGIHSTKPGVLDIRTSRRIQKCRSWNVVYGITCTVCQKIVYVGETSRTVKERLKEHDAHVRHGRNKPVADHFGSSGHTAENMGVTVLEVIRDSSKYYLQVRELEWIELLETEVPNGVTKKTKVGVLWHEYR